MQEKFSSLKQLPRFVLARHSLLRPTAEASVWIMSAFLLQKLLSTVLKVFYFSLRVSAFFFPLVWKRASPLCLSMRTDCDCGYVCFYVLLYLNTCIDNRQERMGDAIGRNVSSRSQPAATGEASAGSAVRCAQKFGF